MAKQKGFPPTPATKAMAPLNENTPDIKHRAASGKFKPHPQQVKGLHKKPKKLNTERKPDHLRGEGV